MTDVECTGNEMSLEDCPHTSGNITCSRNEGAGVECSGYDGMFESTMCISRGSMQKVVTSMYEVT